MENLFPHFENYLAYLGNIKWMSTNDPSSIFNKAFRNAHFIESLYSRLNEENRLEEFKYKYYTEYKNEAVSEISNAVIQKACDALLSCAFTNHNRKKTVHAAIMEYIQICGSQRLMICLKTLLAENIALQALTDIVSDPTNFQSPEDHEKTSRKIWMDLLSIIMDLCSETDWHDTCNTLMQSKPGIESLLMITVNDKEDLESKQLSILNQILQHTVNVDSNMEIQNFWKTFINCDRKILIEVFVKYSWFFEEFFEFVVRTAHDFHCSYEREKCEWTGTSWLTYMDLVTFVKWLWNVESSVSDYVQHAVTQTRGQPIWQDVRQEFLTLP
jgi:hypothetical protein